jgi:hypothetical protein
MTMSTNTKTVKASCLCGKASYDLTLPASEFPLQSMWCHCGSCRHKTGTLSQNICDVPDSFQPPKELFEELTPYEFSERLTEYFCKTCGALMLTHAKRGAYSSRGAHWDVMSGTLEKAEGVFELVGYEYVADTIDGGFADFLPSVNGKQLERWPVRPNQGEQLPLYWQSPDRPNITPDPADKLHCHCKCGGVEFWIARPSERSKKALGPWPDLIIPYHSTEPRPDHSGWWLRDNGKKFLAGNCSCNSCRLDTGMEFQSWCFIPTIDISLDVAGKKPYSVPFGTLKAYQSSPDVTRYHCGVCGASVFFTCEDRTDLVDVAVGLLDAPEGARAESWLEWRMNRLSFREDAFPRAETLTLAMEEGQQAWAERQKK